MAKLIPGMQKSNIPRETWNRHGDLLCPMIFSQAYKTIDNLTGCVGKYRLVRCDTIAQDYGTL